MKDFKCDLNCPAVNDVFIDGICCNNCYRTKKQYLTDQNRHLWVEWDGKPSDANQLVKGVLKIRHTVEEGFYHPDKGCKLSREDMPAECRAYDCKNDMFYLCEFKYARLVWDGQKWTQVRPVTLFARGVILKGHIDSLFLKIRRDILRFCYGK